MRMNGNGVADEPRHLPSDKARQKGMQVRTSVDTCTRGLLVWMQSALEPSASAADEYTALFTIGVGSRHCKNIHPPPTLMFFSSFPLKEGFSNTQLIGSRERLKPPEWSLGRSPCGSRIWCILALTFDILSPGFHRFS